MKNHSKTQQSDLFLLRTRIVKNITNTIGDYNSENYIQKTKIMRYKMKNGNFSKTILNSTFIFF